MKTLCFSSFTFSYLNRARVLFTSLRHHQPDWVLSALITDRPPPGFAFSPASEPFDEVVWAEDLPIENFDKWLFQHTVVEACTAVKGFYLRAACEHDYDAIVYLDPDIAVFGSLDPVLSELDNSDILLTPHLIAPESAALAIVDNEIGALKTGTFNLGFVAIRPNGDGLKFARWWEERLRSFCFDEIPRGLFTDQRWCDLVPALFESVKIVRDPGCNVASWNLSTRKVDITKGGEILVNGSPLKFWHFTKLGAVADAMTRRYAGNNYQVYEIWNWYKRRVAECTDSTIPADYWAYATFDDGTRISDEQRRIYRDRPDLQDRFSYPFFSGTPSFQDWLKSGHRANGPSHV